MAHWGRGHGTLGAGSWHTGGGVMACSTVTSCTQHVMITGSVYAFVVATLIC